MASIPMRGCPGARDGYDMLNLHRNKRSLSLNLKRKEGLDIFLEVVETAEWWSRIIART